jgi:WD40 repeat protein
MERAQLQRFNLNVPALSFIAQALPGSNSQGTPVTVHVWEAARGNTIAAYRGHTSGVFTTTWSPDGKLLAVGETGQIELFNANSDSRTYTNGGRPGDVTAMIWSPESTRLASGSSKGPVRVWRAV